MLVDHTYFKACVREPRPVSTGEQQSSVENEETTLKKKRRVDIPVTKCDTSEAIVELAKDDGQNKKSSSEPSMNQDEIAVSSTTEEVAEDCCNKCGSIEPPCKKNFKNRKVRKAIQWIGCDECNQWYHMVCVGLTTAVGNYLCYKCQMAS